MEIGTITQEMLGRMPLLIDMRQRERDARRIAEAQIIAEMNANATVTMFAATPSSLLPYTATIAHALVGERIQFGYDLGLVEFVFDFDINFFYQYFGGLSFEPWSTQHWRILDVQDNRALIISHGVLFEDGNFIIPFHGTGGPVTWETSDIRHFLNGEFLNRFSPDERERIALTHLVNSDNQWFGTPGGNDTQDRIFLLSIEEVVRYFGDSGQLANRPPHHRWDNTKDATYIYDEYNRQRGFGIVSYAGGTWEGEGFGWLLRSPGAYSDYVALIPYQRGTIDMYGKNVSTMGWWYRAAVRPAMWIYLD